MKKILKTIIPIVFVICSYTTLYFFFTEFGEPPMIISMMGAIIFGILNIVMAIIYTAKKDKEALLLSGVLIKSLMIAFYIIVFLLAIGASALLAIFMGVFSLLTTIPAIIFDIFVLIISSSYMLGYLILDFKENRKASSILQCFLQFIYVIDVLDMIFICFFKEKKHRVLTSTIIVLSLIAQYVIYLLIR